MDTSAWYAAADGADRSHERAKAVLSATEALVTTDHVLIETWMLLRHRIGRKQALVFWERLGSVAMIESVTSADVEVARQIAEAWNDQDFSIVDCTSFAVMQRLGIRRAASYDADFGVFRFGPGRRLAFDVVR
ncbi:MAG: PIN domain-containing protein [Acidobacteriota bacterium]|nr:PIN domain-containing protein [Acidobacteriota bacterium]